jgi:hypothetical protein
VSSALVPYASTSAVRRASDASASVSYEDGELVIRLRPSGGEQAGQQERPAEYVTVRPIEYEREFDADGPLDSPFHPSNGYDGSLRWVPGVERVPYERTRARILRHQRRRDRLSVKWQKYGACPCWLRWAYRWLP